MDNSAVVRRTGDLLKGVRYKPNRPWQLMPDGHMWEALDKALGQRGTDTFAVTWVKGHATQEHVKAGQTTERDRLGNEEADKLADKGVEELGDGLALLCHYYMGKQSEQVKLLRRIHKMFHRVLTKEKEIREKKEIR